MGIFSKIKNALQKTSEKIVISVTGDKVSPETITSAEESLIMADVGVETTGLLIEKISGRKFPSGSTEVDVRKFLAEEIANLLKPYESDFWDKKFEHDPMIILVIGVNGNGKTTTIAKITNLLKQKNYSPMLVAADTFRAAASEQLQYWAEKIGVPICRGKEGCDAAGLVYSSIESARKNKNNVLLIDTAGRMQNRNDLLDELEKIKRVIKKTDSTAPHQTILIIDGFTGQAADKQVSVFKEKIGIDGIIVTKLDGTAKGGVVISLTQKYKLPILALGVGESSEDMISFNASDYAKAVMGI